jgi:hypothetical protein
VEVPAALVDLVVVAVRAAVVAVLAVELVPAEVNNLEYQVPG